MQGTSLSVPAAHNPTERGWNSYKPIQACLVLPSPAAEQSQREAAALQCLQELSWKQHTVRLLLKGGKRRILHVPVQEWVLCMQWAAKGSSEREMLPIWNANLLQQRLWLDPWTLEKIQQDGLSVLGQKSERCAHFPKLFAMCMEAQGFILLQNVQVWSIQQHESNIKPLTLTTA